MSRRRRYLVGIGMVALAALAIRTVLAPADRPALDLALGLTALVQGPLGWWLVRSVGRDRFLLAWVVGMLARALLVGVVGVVVLPALDWPLAPALVALVALLGAGLLVEIVTLSVEPSRARHE